MVEQQGANPSQFNARADNAALLLRQQLQKQGRQLPDKATVAVGPDGKPPQPPPPPGSYMRQMVEQQRAQGAQDAAAAMQQGRVINQQAPVAETDQMAGGSVDPARLQGQTTQEPAESISPRAERRIRDLVDELRRKDQELQQIMAKSKVDGDTVAELSNKFAALQQQHERMIQANLEHLDPETRMQVMQDARLQEALAGMEQRIMGRLQPQLRTLEQNNSHAEMMRLSEKYPHFVLAVHGPLIEVFRGKNPACTIEQAFRAIAEGDELETEPEVRAAAVPPVLAPGNGSPHPRYAPQPKSNPDDELVEESRRIAKLRSSLDPRERAEGLRLADQHLKRRLQR